MWPVWMRAILPLPSLPRVENWAGNKAGPCHASPPTPPLLNLVYFSRIFSPMSIKMREDLVFTQSPNFSSNTLPQKY
jgi:hypothetical protein